MRFNNSSMALLDIPDLPERAFIRKAVGGIIPQGGGGGGSPAPAPQSTTNTTNTSNIPTYAQPYVENMLAATQAQLFQTTPGGTDAQGNPIQNITGFAPYQAYGSVNPDGTTASPTQAAQAAVASFQPMQTQAQQGIAGLQNPHTYNQALGVTGQGIGQAGMYGQLGAQAGLGYGQQATDPNAVAAYMNPYIENTLTPSMQLLNQQYGIQQAANQGRQTQAGAFGGSRGSLENSLNQQNQMLAQNQLVGNAFNQAYNTANQNMQAAAGLGMQGAQAGLAGNAQQMAAASQLANLGQQQQTNQENIYGLQNQYGAQQQAYNQSVINQAMQNYANAQQYPIMELGTMSNMLRGLPMQATTTNQFQATPSPLSQIIGAAGVGSTLSALTKGSKKGGLQKDTTGINSYDVGGAIRADLENMPTDALEDELKKTQSPIIKSDIQQIMAMRSAVPQSKSGGIMSYEGGGTPQAPGGANEGNAGEEEAARYVAANPGILGASTAPAQPPTPQQQQAQLDQQAVAGITQITDPTERALAQANWNRAAKEAAMTPDERMDIQQKLYDKYLGKDTTLDELTKEKANARAEGERQRQLRLGQFFASWGSMPGPTLVAGLSAFAKTVPSMIADSDKQAEIMHKLDDSIIQVNRADRLRKMGMINEADKETKDAQANVYRINEDINKIVIRQRQEAAKRAEEQEKRKWETSEKALDRASREKEAGIHAAGVKAGYELQDTRDLRNNLAKFSAQEEAIRTHLDKIKADPMYKVNLQTLNRADATPEQKSAAQNYINTQTGEYNENRLLETQLMRQAIEKELMGKDKNYKPSNSGSSSSSGSAKDLSKYDK